MQLPFVLLKHIGKAVLNVVGGGIVGDVIVEMLPQVAREAWESWSKERNEEQRRVEMQSIVQAGVEQIRQDIAEVKREVAADKSEEVRLMLESYLTQVPAMIQRSLRRPSDPTGTTVPASFVPRKAEDLLPFLPTRLPRFKKGDRPLPSLDWELEQLLGVGGFGEVWKARNPNMPSSPPVALKFCLDASAAKALRNETALLDRVLRQGRHSGIVQLLDTYLNAETPCLKYEYIEGGDLTGLIQDYHRQQKGGPSPVFAAKVIMNLAKTLEYAHRSKPPIVHRDLKPANILVQRSPEGLRFKIADFGIGGIATSQAIKQANQGMSQAFVMTSVASGSCTPLYASPQQMRGGPPDPRDDVFSLGVIWYQMLTGELANGRPGGTLWHKRLIERGLPPKMVDLLASCFEESPEDRPADAGVLASELTGILKAEQAPKAKEQVQTAQKSLVQAIPSVEKQPKEEQVEAPFFKVEISKLRHEGEKFTGMEYWVINKSTSLITVHLDVEFHDPNGASLHRDIGKFDKVKPNTMNSDHVIGPPVVPAEIESWTMKVQRVTVYVDEDGTTRTYDVDAARYPTWSMVGGPVVTTHSFFPGAPRKQQEVANAAKSGHLPNSEPKQPVPPLAGRPTSQDEALTSGGHLGDIPNILKSKFSPRNARLEAVQEIAKHNLRQHTEMLKELVESDNDDAVRNAAFETLRQWGVGGWDIQQLLQSKCGKARLEAVQEIAKQNLRQFSVRLREMVLSESDHAVSKAVFETLEQWKVDLPSQKTLVPVARTASDGSVWLMIESQRGNFNYPLWNPVIQIEMKELYVENDTVSGIGFCLHSLCNQYLHTLVLDFEVIDQKDKSLQSQVVYVHAVDTSTPRSKVLRFAPLAPNDIKSWTMTLQRVIVDLDCDATKYFTCSVEDLPSAKSALKAAQSQTQAATAKATDKAKPTPVVSLPSEAECATAIEVRRLEGHTDDVSCVAFSHDGRWVASGSVDKTVRLWDAQTGKEPKTFTGHADVVMALCFAPNSRFLLSSCKHQVYQWEVESGSKKDISLYHSTTLSLAISSDSRRSLHGLEVFQAAELFDLRAGNKVRQFRNDKDGAILCISFSPDDSWAVCGSIDGIVYVWDVLDGMLLTSYSLGSQVNQIALSRDGLQTLFGCNDGVVRLKETKTGKDIKQFVGHTKPITAIALFSDGRYALSASEDNTGRIWDVIAGKEVSCFTGPSGRNVVVAFSRDCQVAISGHPGGAVRLWKLPTSLQVSAIQSPPPALGVEKSLGEQSMQPVSAGNPQLSVKQRALISSIEANTDSSFTLQSRKVGDDGLTALAGSDGMARLRRFNLSYDDIGDAGVEVLASSAKVQSLTHLELYNNRIGDIGAAALASSPFLVNLTELNLASNKIGDEGAAALAASRCLSKLTKLRLAGNNISEKGMGMLLERFDKVVSLY